MDNLEQRPPNKVNFGLVVGLFCATLLIIFVLALLFVHSDGKHLTFGHRRAHPTSRLVTPEASDPSLAVMLA